MGRFEAALQTLELDQTASCEEIKQAYKDLVVVWHPDRFPHNPRLRQKAEEKLKRFNQAYEHLQGWQQPRSARQPRRPSTAPFGHRPSPASPRRSQSRSPRAHRRPSRTARPSPARATPSNPCISLATAEFILQRYRFESLSQADQPQRQYQGGPFVIMVCDAPPEVMISVPCDSLQQFDRILLSIPCKSMGHFIQQDAEQLLRLLQTQASSRCQAHC